MSLRKFNYHADLKRARACKLPCSECRGVLLAMAAGDLLDGRQLPKETRKRKPKQ
jgi:hypothetical protein